MSVKNFADMELAMIERRDFTHRSYRGITTDQGYELWHWNTLIAVIKNGYMSYGDLSYYSQTTSEFQGRILRSLGERAQREVLELYKGTPRGRAIRNMLSLSPAYYLPRKFTIHATDGLTHTIDGRLQYCTKCHENLEWLDW